MCRRPDNRPRLYVRRFEARVAVDRQRALAHKMGDFHPENRPNGAGGDGRGRALVSPERCMSGLGIVWCVVSLCSISELRLAAERIFRKADKVGIFAGIKDAEVLAALEKKHRRWLYPDEFKPRVKKWRLEFQTAKTMA